MNKFLSVIFLSGLALVGNAEARLGETLEKCEKEYGKLNDPDGEMKMADPEKYFAKIAKEEVYGLQLPIDRVFRKSDNTCIFVGVSELYGASEKTQISFPTAQKFIEKNIPVSAGKLTIVFSEGFENGVPSSNKWVARWADPDEEITALAVCGQKRKKRDQELLVNCVQIYTKEFGDDMRDWNENRKQELRELFPRK